MHPDVVIVGESSDGADALKQIAALRPDVVLLDLEMPEINGIEVLRRLQNWDTVPIVVIVTADQKRGQAALRFGAVDCLHKPVSPARLFRSLEAIQKRTSTNETGW